MGSILTLLVTPSPLGDVADDGLATGLDGDMLDPDHLLALAAVLAQRVEQHRVGSRQLVGRAEVACRPSKLCSASIARRKHSRLAAWQAIIWLMSMPSSSSAGLAPIMVAVAARYCRLRCSSSEFATHSVARV